ncbi:DUF4178 domain-containing protein [Curvibacter sp. CHRR-16]|uniref:DUF4178 domain-containing protein n=1 Tax=Curvibacter sp. CHRR-16 TaxID=2835872 RepID=UPI001BDB12F1|nr:DUF4178 domain-containing protein [Curvibacter sp. CHRR-16]MBT0570359.1 DUF4178 domain-containing protein [Curvibacter sp. CHRR-16]
MSTANTPYRQYQAPCPGCGAPVVFASAQSTHAVCVYCQSSIARDGEVLRRIGKVAELFDDHSPLTLGASGQYQGQAFTLVGRLQYQYDEGVWSEWYALLADGSGAWLSEDNGSYVFCTQISQQRSLPEAANFRVGATTAINGKTFRVASNQTVHVRSAQGELPTAPVLERPFALVELRSDAPDSAGQVLSLDYSTQPPTATLGRAVELDALRLQGLQDSARTKDEKGRQFNCPQCGATLNALLPKTVSMSCSSCHSLIDLSSGIGGELRHAQQDEPIQPQIPLGSYGVLQGLRWQVVGFQHRMGVSPADTDESFGWEEYLLYHPTKGFQFLVDSTEGWSLVRPATGAPALADNGQSARYLGKTYRLTDTYRAETNYVVGEFYWRVQRGQVTQNRDFKAGKNFLNLEQSAKEMVWSVGSAIDSETVAKAFGQEAKKADFKRGGLLGATAAGSALGGLTHRLRQDVSPLSSQNPFWQRPDFWLFVVFLLIVLAISRCSSCDPNVENCSSGSYRTGGGSWGGFSTGGGHK